ncbi:MAG: hypothetical protein M1828_006019 [Chrysothrix sp. TS-e1954]|nr:MAG: hypothetical protein M1828_006019 [Chrysothrix sp. TS-e1954]
MRRKKGLESNETSQTPEVIIPPLDPWPRPYHYSDGLRRVQPYHYTYKTYCKERWRGRPILEIFEDEFRDRPVEYYKRTLESGGFAINGKTIYSPATIVSNGDLISHTVHRHEPPVIDQPIGVVHEDDNIVVINKPASIPVHPTGRYNYNSLTEIMSTNCNRAWMPRPCNRLDRLTSGIMFIGKTPEGANKMSKQIASRHVKKEYVARVIGEFPDGEVVCEQPILQISPKLGLNRIRANGKEARTVFRRLAYYPPASITQVDSQDQDVEARLVKQEQRMPWKKKQGYSIVRCRPVTGRTHQLRVHLQYLGHPISNDPIYCNRRVFGVDLGKGDTNGDRDEDIMSRLNRMCKSEIADTVAYHEEIAQSFRQRKAERMTDEVCDVCETELYSDPGPHELGIYLHARKYACADEKWSFETSLPLWALPPPGYDGPNDTTLESDPLETRLRGLNADGTTASDENNEIG